MAIVRGQGAATFFLTLSANDAGWDDIAIVLGKCNGQAISNAAQEDEFLHCVTTARRHGLLTSNEVLVATHFVKRWQAFMQVLLKGHPTDPADPNSPVFYPIGKVTNYFWRIEFQNRGSPHVHSLWWVEGAPNPDTPEGLAQVPEFVARYIWATCPIWHPLETDSGKQLRLLVCGDGETRGVQQHQHRDTCRKGLLQEGHINRHPCRFRYPKPVSTETRLKMSSDINTRKSELYILERGAGDINVVPYNPTLLRLWGANMDIQFVGSMHGTAAYVCSYMTKSETSGLKSVVSNALATLPADSSFARRLQRVGTAGLGQREYSVQEATYLLMGYKLKGMGCTIVDLNVGFPENRVRVINTAAFRDAVGDPDRGRVYGDMPDNAGGHLATNIYEYFPARPHRLHHLSMHEFVAQYDLRTSAPRGAAAEDEIRVRPKYGESPSGEETVTYTTRWVVQRTSHALVRVRPHMTPESKGDEFYYSLTCMHHPWHLAPEQMAGYRLDNGSFVTTQMFYANERAAVIGEHATALEAFMAHGEVMMEHLDRAALADDLRARMDEVDALDQDLRVEAHAGVAAHAQSQARRQGQFYGVGA
jgi:hypothetical protein